MNIIKLNDQVSVSDQISVNDVSELKDLGIELLVCNRPDSEDEGQTPFLDIENEAHKRGIETQLLAFTSYQIECRDRDGLIDILSKSKRTHLYCRSGARSKRLWRMANKIGCGGHDYLNK